MANLLASASNSSPNKYSPYDVFLNHRGPDTKLSIASDVYSSLTPHRLRVFLDKEEMEKGDSITSQIAAAIREASVHIAIFSPGYADSEWCLQELQLMMESMQKPRGSTIIPVFYHVKPADLRWTQGENGVYGKALTRLQEKKTVDSKTDQEKPRYDSDAIEKWRNVLSEVSYISGFELEAPPYNGEERKLVEDLVKLVLRKVNRSPLDVSKYPTGLDQKVQDFDQLLQQQSGGPRVVGIVGLGGIGKTTLAKEIFNRLRPNYQHSCFLFDIREKSLTTLQINLLEDLSPKADERISSEDEGKGILRRNLLSKEAVIVLDNVDRAEQLEALLLPAKCVLHSSSTILVTSRDKQLLISQDIKEPSIYKLERLNNQHSLELFCWHAFDKPHPDEGFDKIVEKFLGACQGLPLSLKVLGALLRGNEDLNHWEAQFRKISKLLPDDIQSRLKISYDSLDEEQKEIFLDTACFFTGEHMETAIRIWKGSDWEGLLGLRNLQNKCLVEIDSESRITMHDHLRDLGRGIGEKKSPHRLWRLTDKLLDDLPDKLTVRGINMIKASVENRAELANRCLRGLKLLIAESDCFDESIFRRSHLLWLRWKSCPYSSLPLWIPTGSLRVLELEGGATLKTLWRENDNFQAPLQLREMNIIDISLLEIPKSIVNLQSLEKFILRFTVSRETLPDDLCLPDEFCRLQRLEHLEIVGCSMKSLPDSFGKLTNLQHIELCHLKELKRLPDSFGELKNVQYIDLSGCEIGSLPHSFGKLKNLQQINLFYCTKIKSLPDSFGELNNLQYINLSNCAIIESLPNSFGELKNLQHINLAGCFEIKSLPHSFEELKNLRHIDFSGCIEIESLPDSFGELKNLEHINLSFWCKLKKLPHSFGELENLQYINLWQCRKLERLPNSFENLKNLRYINLTGCSKLQCLPDSFCNFKQLQHLELKDCSELNFSPGTFGKISTLQYLDLSGCAKIDIGSLQVPHNRLLGKLFLINTNLEELPRDIGELSDLQVLHLGSQRLEMLPASLGQLQSLQELLIFNCGRLKRLPDSIGSLTKLRKLNIKNSGVESLPRCVIKLNSLEELIIEDCPFSELPFRKVEGVEVGECMVRLEYLELSCIEISEISFSEGVCPNLRYLDIYGCGSLEEVGALPKSLGYINLSKCCALRKIGGLCGPEKLQKLKLLECDEVEELPKLKQCDEGEVLLIAMHENARRMRQQVQLLEKLHADGYLELLNPEHIQESDNLKTAEGLEYVWKQLADSRVYQEAGFLPF